MLKPFCWALVVTLAAAAKQAGPNPAPFEPASTPEQVMRQHRALRTDDIWWVTSGPDQGWNFRNLQQIFPTVPVYRSGPVRELAYRPMEAVAAFPVETPEGRMPYRAFLDSDQSTTMGVVILHRGAVVFEHYPRMKPHEKTVMWSVTKVVVSLVVAILEDRGLIDVSKPIDFYIGELRQSAYAGVTVRNILDMATGLDCPENYEDKRSCYYRYSAAIGDGFREADAPDNPYDYVASLKVPRVVEQGTSFDYTGVNTFVLAWLVERVAAMPFQDAVSREIWTRIGAEADAAFLAPRYGIAVSHGGLLAKLRDVARFGLLYTPGYTAVTDTKIVSDRYLELIRNGGNPALLRNARFPGQRDESVKHNVYQWDRIYRNGDFYKGGWAGQGLITNPDRDVVAVWAGYMKDGPHREANHLPIVRSVLEGVFGGTRQAGGEAGSHRGSVR